MRLIYSLLMYLLTPYLFLRLWIKGRRLPAYKNRIRERFALSNTPLRAVDVWVHAVSLGEVIAAIPLIDALIKTGQRVLVTTMTPTGSSRVQERFSDKVSHCYIPYDLPWALRRFFRQVKPKLGIIMETELWPNLIYEAKKAKIPLLLANARLSQRSFEGYLRFKCFFKPMLNQFNFIAAQSDADARRFVQLGANEEQVKVFGNIKFDLQTHKVDSTVFESLKSLWGKDRVVVILASTHEDEEAQVLKQFNRLKQAIPDVVVLVAPRHPERFASVYQWCLHAGLNTGLRSNETTISIDNQVIVLDCLGELLGFYQCSDYAFVGGSLVSVGGHNVLEPIAMNTPVFSGSHVHHFKAIFDDLIVAKAVVMVENAQQLVDEIITLYQNQELKQQMMLNASDFLMQNKGALERHLQVVHCTLQQGS